MNDAMRKILNEIKAAQEQYANTIWGDWRDKYDALTEIGKLFDKLRAARLLENS